ncbi:MAG: DUF5317 domain-containing protein [Actinomycetota bacterium]
MLLVVCFALTLMSVPIAGGRLSKLADWRPSQAWSILVAVGLQIAIISVFPGKENTLRLGVHLLSYGFILVFLVANRRVPGLWVVAMGAAMNFVAISANRGVMPATEAALRAAGRVIAAGDFSNSAALAEPKFAFLGDVFAIPAGLPFANVFSPGDICIVVGAALVVYQLARPARGSARPSAVPAAAQTRR